MHKTCPRTGLEASTCLAAELTVSAALINPKPTNNPMHSPASAIEISWAMLGLPRMCRLRMLRISGRLRTCYAAHTAVSRLSFNAIRIVIVAALRLRPTPASRGMLVDLLHRSCVLLSRCESARCRCQRSVQPRTSRLTCNQKLNNCWIAVSLCDPPDNGTPVLRCAVS